MLKLLLKNVEERTTGKEIVGHDISSRGESIISRVLATKGKWSHENEEIGRQGPLGHGREDLK